MSDADVNTADDAIAILRVKASEFPSPSSRRSAEQTVDTFARFIGADALSLSDIDEELVAEWASRMLGSGYTHKTVLHYLNILSSLSRKAANDLGIEPVNSFAVIKARIVDVSPAALEISAVPDCFGKLRSLALSDCSSDSARQLAKDLTLFSLYLGGLSLERIAQFRKDEYTGSDEGAMAIVARYSTPKRKYLFPLGQSSRTPAQLNRAVAALLAKALESVGISLSEYANTTPSGLWAACAQQCGFSAMEIAACLGTAADSNLLCSIAPQRELAPERIAEMRSRVARALATDPEDWYAMQFRPHVDYDKVQARLDADAIAFSKSFYPMEEIARRVGKRIKRETRPVMPGLFFFKSRAAQLSGLFNQIGDLAWGYRTSRKARSPYAPIPQRAIEEYQHAVGKFIDGIDAHPEGSLSLEPGDPVEIIGGEYAGIPAIFEKEVRHTQRGSHPIDRLTYRLRLSPLENYTWTVDLDPRQLTKA